MQRVIVERRTQTSNLLLKKLPKLFKYFPIFIYFSSIEGEPESGDELGPAEEEGITPFCWGNSDIFSTECLKIIINLI
jgi:hypothetical protein